MLFFEEMDKADDRKDLFLKRQISPNRLIRLHTNVFFFTRCKCNGATFVLISSKNNQHEYNFILHILTMLFSRPSFFFIV